jgi:hypothetical protein
MQEQIAVAPKALLDFATIKNPFKSLFGMVAGAFDDNPNAEQQTSASVAELRKSGIKTSPRTKQVYGNKRGDKPCICN